MLTQIHHKKNELFEVEFYKDEECTEAFDFTNAKDLYIELKDRDMTPLVAIHLNDTLAVKTYNKLYVSYLPYNFERYKAIFDFKTLDDVTPNLSKYIPEDNAVLFLSEEGYKRHKDCFIENYIDNFFKKLGFLIEGRYDTIYSTRPFVYDKDLDFGLKKPHPKTRNVCWGVKQTNKLTIFLHHGTKSELQKANEVAKELKEKYGVEEVNLCVLHYFQKEFYIKALYENELKKLVVFNETYNNPPSIVFKTIDEQLQDLAEDTTFINKIITTNSTGILPVQDNERLQVIDCKEIFEEYLKENN